jgi:hypothetical protein
VSAAYRLRVVGVVLAAGFALAVSTAGALAVEDGKPKLAITKSGQARAQRIGLRLGDFGPGWRAEKGADNNSSSKCFNRDLSALTLNGRAESPDFFHGAVTFAASLSAVFATAPQARRAFAALRSALDDCLVRELDKQSGIDDVSGGPLSFPRLGERSTAFQVVGHAKEGELSVAIYADVVVIQRERALALLVFADMVTPFEESLKERLARAVAQRMKPHRP